MAGNSRTALYVAVLVVMFIIFVLIRELWQKGGKPLQNIPGVDFWAIGLLVVFLILVWYIHKKTTEPSSK